MTHGTWIRQTAEHAWKAGTLVPLPAAEPIPYKPGNNRSTFSCISRASVKSDLPAGFVSSEASLLGFPSTHVIISSFLPMFAGAYVCICVQTATSATSAGIFYMLSTHFYF